MNFFFLTISFYKINCFFVNCRAFHTAFYFASAEGKVIKNKLVCERSRRQAKSQEAKVNHHGIEDNATQKTCLFDDFSQSEVFAI